jgi:hypothetical protein
MVYPWLHSPPGLAVRIRVAQAVQRDPAQAVLAVPDPGPTAGLVQQLHHRSLLDLQLSGIVTPDEPTGISYQRNIFLGSPGLVAVAIRAPDPARIERRFPFESQYIPTGGYD